MRGPSAVTRGSTLWVLAGLAERQSTARQPREPQQSPCLTPQAQVQPGDRLEVAHAASGSPVSRRTARPSRAIGHYAACQGGQEAAVQPRGSPPWVADGADRAPGAHDDK
jgi:hypothetical protein